MHTLIECDQVVPQKAEQLSVSNYLKSVVLKKIAFGVPFLK